MPGRPVFEGTPYWGAYMTDFLKDFEMVESSSVIRRLEQETLPRGREC
jgi:hypothetical protein